MSELQVFNSPLEVGIRILVVLNAFRETANDLDKLVYMDYFLIHSGDLKDGPESIHPPSPFRVGELAVKRDILKKSLQILHKKSLVDVIFDKKGIFYKSSESGTELVDGLVSTYCDKLKDRAFWLASKFKDSPESDFRQYISDNTENLNFEFFKKR